MYDHGFASLSMRAQVLEFYLRTCPQRASEGLFRFNVGTIADDLGMERTDILEATEELSMPRRPFFFDLKAGVVLDLSALRDNPLGKQRSDEWKGPDKRIIGAIRKMKSLPETPLLKHLLVLADKHSPELAERMREEFPDIEEPLPKSLEAPSSPSMALQAPSREESETSSEEESRDEASITSIAEAFNGEVLDEGASPSDEIPLRKQAEALASWNRVGAPR
jgi:hypothetical protein